MAEDKIRIYGAREHNLRDLTLELPRGKLIVFCGVSGSGKSSLAFDTIYAEGQRRYVESLSTHARQFLGGMTRPAVDHIDGLSPAIAIDQASASSNPRSTVATITEIYDYLRVLYARTGQPYCVKCGIPITAATPQMIVDKIMALGEGTRLMILAPVQPAPGEAWKHVLREARRSGFARIRLDGQVIPLDQPIDISEGEHSFEVVVDRLALSDRVQARLADSVETALAYGGGRIVAAVLGDTEDETRDLRFSTHFACSQCQAVVPPMSPQLFSFNSPHGMCPTCGGLGYVRDMDPDRFVADPGKSILQGALSPFGDVRGGHLLHTLTGLAQHYDFSLDTPWRDLPAHVREVILYGSRGEEIAFSYETQHGRTIQYHRPFRGLVVASRKRYEDTDSRTEKSYLERYLSELPCPDCEGRRLRPEALAVRVADRGIAEVTALDVEAALSFLSQITLPATEGVIAAEVLKEITARLRFMVDVGVGYLSLDRPAPTLSGGEAQRIRLATQMGSGLAGVLYILDEPSIGLHPRDQAKLLETIRQLRDLGNTVIVVEHDIPTIESADYVVEFGPGAGIRGGELIYAGDVAGMRRDKRSLTGRYLSGELRLGTPRHRRRGKATLKVIGATEHNLQHIDVELPLGTLICVTGVSGSGKSTLVHDVIYRALKRYLHRSRDLVGRHERIEGLEHLDKVINIDQSPIGRTPRSNPATYAHVFGPIRDLFAATPEAQVRGYQPGRFSFNVRGGRCELCQGDGTIRVEMHFLPPVYVPCEQCGGRRYNRETLQIRYKGKNIAEVLDMTVAEALEHFENVPQVSRVLRMLYDVGLDYIRLGQSGTTLSGGEAQRLKLARELAKIGTGQTLYVLDEPTTGLHFADIEKLLQVLERLVDAGNTVIVIEHNLDVIKTADYIVDLGPEGGKAGGEVVACGTPEQVAANPRSYTGQFLKQVLD
ncbi:MAG: excinuclease ABC subunit UvrA [Armatimonadetes bacterium]|nr:excinuclease ABC subunit UvrA [Armatimonadota bacterium]